MSLLDAVNDALAGKLVTDEKDQKQSQRRYKKPTAPVVALPKNPIQTHPVESTKLAEIGFDPDRKMLAIRFPGRGVNLGSLYYYSNFNETDWQAFNDAESLGAYFTLNILPHVDRYPCVKIDESAGAQ